MKVEYLDQRVVAAAIAERCCFYFPAAWSALQATTT